MNNKYIFLIFLSVLNSCYFNKIDKYPLEMVDKNNYKNINFKYNKMRTIEYEFCNRLYFIFEKNEYSFSNIINLSLEKFNNEYKLKKNEFLININEKNGKTIFIPLVYIKTCKVVEMDLVKKI